MGNEYSQLLAEAEEVSLSTLGGSGDVSKTNTVWTGGLTASFASPVRHESKLYVVARGILTVVDAETGEQTERIRLKGGEQTGGRFGSLDYPSPIVVGDRLVLPQR
jgi:hypothetical protein